MTDEVKSNGLEKLEQMRQKCAARLYSDIVVCVSENAPPWIMLKPEVKDGFLKMAAVVFDELFSQGTEELIEFFSGEKFENFAKRQGYVKEK